MTAMHADEIISGYLTRLETALGPVPSERRRELVDDFRAHIVEARAALPNETDADLLNILDRLGDPAEVAAAEIGREAPAPAKAKTSMALEIAAVILLVLLWPVGVVLLWISNAWTTREKLIGTLVPPGGYFTLFIAAPLLALSAFSTVCQTVSDASGRVVSSTCPSTGAQIGIDVGLGLFFLVYLVVPILSAGYLATRLRRSAPPPSERDRIEAPFSVLGAAPAGRAARVQPRVRRNAAGRLPRCPRWMPSRSRRGSSRDRARGPSSACRTACSHDPDRFPCAAQTGHARRRSPPRTR